MHRSQQQQHRLRSPNPPPCRYERQSFREKRKRSVTPSIVCDNPPKLPKTVYNPTLRCTYRIGDFLGKGGFGWCYSAIDVTNGCSFALKVISKSRLHRQSHYDKVHREISTHRQLLHPHIVRLYSSFEDDHNVYMVIELCKLKSMVNVVHQRGRLTELESAHYLHQLLQAVIYMHSEGILHRDLKLGNMLLTAEMNIKLGDFGLASSFDRILKEQISRSSVSICGTPNYIAPEILRRHGHSKVSESWAIGCILYTMLVGYPPFETDHLENTYSRIQKAEYTIPHECGLSLHAKDLISRLLHLEPKCRPVPIEIISHPFFRANNVISMLPAFTLQVEVEEMRSRIFPQPLDLSLCRPSQSSQQLNDELLTLPPCSLQNINNCRYERGSVLTRSKGSRGSISSGDSGLGSDPRIQFGSLHEFDTAKIFQRYIDFLTSFTDGKGKNQLQENRTLSKSVLYVAKWVDYMNKYGFGCQFSDGSRCVIFNDKTVLSTNGFSYQLSVSSSCPSRCWYRNEQTPFGLSKYVRLLTSFSHYMDNKLIQGGDVQAMPVQDAQIPSLFYFRRDSNYIFMILTDGTMQVNFFAEHIKIVLSCTNRSIGVTLINSERRLISLSNNADRILQENPLYLHLLDTTAAIAKREMAILEQMHNDAAAAVL